jgi:putative spermidine/putrescine transport system permease protein
MYWLRRRLGGALILPLLVFMAGAFYYPLAYTVGQSVQPTKGVGLTFANYIGFIASREGRGVLGLTLFLALGATLLSLVLSVPLALMLRRRFAGRAVMRFLIMLPIVIPALVGALGLLFLYDRTGWFNYFLVRVLGVVKQPVPIDYTIPGIILFYIWMFFPYSALAIISGLGAIDPALEEAELVMGATPWLVFRRVVLPLLKPSIWAGAVMVFLQCFGAFSVPLIAGGNYQVLSVRIFTVATVFLNWPQASAMAVIMALVQIILVLAYGRFDRSGARGRP